MIEAKELTKYYGTHPAVRGVSFHVAEGETVGFLGSNGAGKSTTMRMLTGFLAPSSGSASIAGFDMQENSIEARRNLGYLPESTPLYHEMRVEEFMDYRARIKGLAHHARKSAIDEVLQKARIEDMRLRIIGHLSKGYRQRVGLADCLLGRPKLLILDEPTVGLDPNQVIETRGLIREIGEERTVFLSTHILHEVEMIASRVIIINKGEIIAEGKTSELCEKYTGKRTLSVEIISDTNPTSAIEKISGIDKIETGQRDAEGALPISVTCRTGNDPRRDIAKTITENGWLIKGMRLEPVRLEDIFTKLTRDAAKAEKTAQAANT